MTAGARYEYLWADGKTILKPIKCTAREYTEFLLSWVESLLDDEKVFPTQDDFPPNFEATIRQIFKRLFRFYAHIYHNHLKQLEEIGEDRHLNTW
ncbi:Mitotic exit network component [Phlyctochytrium bullatum]|nr:Mitotic exit network component [Phlyctochytrium bullatum]